MQGLEAFWDRFLCNMIIIGGKVQLHHTLLLQLVNSPQPNWIQCGLQVLRYTAYKRLLDYYTQELFTHWGAQLGSQMLLDKVRQLQVLAGQLRAMGIPVPIPVLPAPPVVTVGSAAQVLGHLRAVWNVSDPSRGQNGDRPGHSAGGQGGLGSSGAGQ